VLIADKGYDASEFIKAITEAGIEAGIQQRSNRRGQHDHDRNLYRGHHLVGCIINKIKQYRSLFSHFENLSKNYLCFLSFARACLVTLKCPHNLAEGQSGHYCRLSGQFKITLTGRAGESLIGVLKRNRWPSFVTS
jgi:hypothetical protein